MADGWFARNHRAAVPYSEEAETMKRSPSGSFVAVWVGLAAGCAGDGVPATSTVRLPSVDPGALSGSGASYLPDNGQPAVPCQVRYDYVEVAAPPTSQSPPQPKIFDCSVVIIDGAAHWKIVCPEHDSIPLEDELEFDADGKLAVETRTYPATSGGGPHYLYPDPFVHPPCSVLQTNESGAPTQARCMFPDTTASDGRIIELGDDTFTFAYDGFGRLVDQEQTETASGRTLVGTHVTYDDAARRRDFEVVVLPGDPRQGDNTRSELLDADMRLVEKSGAIAGGDTYDYTYSYDDAGRLVTMTGSEQHVGYWFPDVNYQQHRIFDCQ